MELNLDVLKRLEKPVGKVDVVLDTDTYNEIDDQFALAYLIKSEEKLNLKAIYAAPFTNHKSTGPADGMEKSYNEILRILDLMERPEFKAVTFRGSDRYLENETTPVISDSAEHLAKLAMEYTPENPLYVVTIGAFTNVASALLINPAMADRVVIIWLGGHAWDWPHSAEFNLMQDVAAGRILCNSGAALVELPCFGVVSAFKTSAGELEMFLRGKNKLCDYLVDIVERDGSAESPYKTWTRTIWDVCAVGWLLDENFMSDRLVPTPIPEYDHHMSHDPSRPLMKYVYDINRDALFQDLVNKLTK